MRRRSLLNGSLLSAALALGALALWAPAGDDGSGMRLTSRAPQEARALRVEYPRSDGSQPSLALERRADGWHLTQPIARSARDGRVITALGVFGARSRSCYALKGRDPAAFGLAPPRLLVHSGDLTLAFGDRSDDGRCYIRAGERLCLIADSSYPLLAGGADALATPALLPGTAVPRRIATPVFAAGRENPAAEWDALRGGDAPAEALGAWAARWRAARASEFALAPPAADHGRIRIESTDGVVHEWRIARRAPELMLVPADADYGMILPATRGEALLRPGAMPPADTR